MFSFIRKCFISGILVWVPVVVTIVVVKFLLGVLNQSLLLLPPEYQPDVLLGVHVPGAGVFITLAVIFVTGVLAANYVGGKLVSFSDAIMARIPFVRSVYLGVKQVVQTIVTPGGDSFRKVLLVEYPKEGVWTIAFQTGEVNKQVEGSLGWQETSMISYFVPTTPNPTSGFLMMAPRENVVELDISVDQALKMVISLGVVQPKKFSGKTADLKSNGQDNKEQK